MRILKWTYFHLLDSFIGEVYFRVSRHLSIPISEVILGFYTHDWDILLLMRRYGEEIKHEQDTARKLKKQSKENKNKRRRR